MEFLHPLKSLVNDKFRLKPRIRRLNFLAKKNPKTFFGSFLIIMALIFTMDFLITIVSHKKSEDNIGEILMLSPIFDGMSKIEDNKESLKSFYQSVIEEATILTLQLDSLNQIESKTHQDSIDMAEKINRLNVLNNILSHEQN